MRRAQFIILVSVIVLAWGSLFITVLNQSARTNKLLGIDNYLLSQQKLTINTISANAKIRTQQIADLQAHIDCLFKLATTPHVTTNPPVILDINACDITPSSATPGTPRAAPTLTPNPAPNTVQNSSLPQAAQSATGQGSTPPAKPQPKPKPVKSLVCKVTLGLLAC